MSDGTHPAVQAAAEQVQAAWINPGASVLTHIQAQIRLADEWPTLAHAVIRLSDVLDGVE
jgi:hypothetical protein